MGEQHLASRIGPIRTVSGRRGRCRSRRRRPCRACGRAGRAPRPPPVRSSSKNVVAKAASAMISGSMPADRPSAQASLWLSIAVSRFSSRTRASMSPALCSMSIDFHCLSRKARATPKASGKTSFASQDPYRAIPQCDTFQPAGRSGRRSARQCGRFGLCFFILAQLVVPRHQKLSFELTGKSSLNRSFRTVTNLPHCGHALP